MSHREIAEAITARMPEPGVSHSTRGPGGAERVEILGVPVDSLSVQGLHDRIVKTVRERGHDLILHANAHGLNLCYRDRQLREFFNSASVVFCDGAGVVLAARILGARMQPRITYADWAWRLGQLCESQGLKLFLIGARPGVAEKAGERLRARSPGLKLAGVQHGYFDRTPGSAENEAVIEKINSSGADIVLVGFGMPLQERWLMDNWYRIDARVALTGGAVFDYVSGELKRGPKVLTRFGFEWLARLLIEPTRLWRRYLIGNPVFLARVVAQRLAHRTAHGSGARSG